MGGGVKTDQAEEVRNELPAACRVLTDGQAGIIARRQAMSAGLPPDVIDGLVRTGRWQRLDYGVYAAFTGEPGREARWWAALLRAGPEAVLSHWTAAVLCDIIGEYYGPVHVTVPRASKPRRIPGVVVHRMSRTRADRHPVLLPPRTTVEATVLDLAAAARSAEDAFGWVFRATGQRLTTGALLRAALATRPAMRWRGELIQSLGEVGEGVQSSLEYRYVRDVERAHGLPRAARQVRVIRDGTPRYLDNFYELAQVGVELDGRTAHPRGERFRDFRRDNAGAADGILTLRYGWSDVTASPCQVAAQVAAVLSRRGDPTRPRRCSPTCPGGVTGP
jgi:very-short-patch-repair endonuclease